MIGRLTGLIVERDSLHGGCVVDVHGVGYEVFLPLRSLAALPQPPAQATIHVHTHVREEAFVLYGFESLDDRSLFRSLTAVSGVGPKVAMAILSDMTFEVLCRAVADGDKKRFGAVSGVGPKLAARLALELRDKVPLPTGLPASAAAVATKSVTPTRMAPPATVADEVVLALVSLGFQRPQAETAVGSILQPDESRPVEQLLRLALSNLS